MCYTKVAQGGKPPQNEVNNADIIDALSSAILGRRYQADTTFFLPPLPALSTRIFNLSLGQKATQEYPAIAKLLDGLVYQQSDVSLVVAAGNDGDGGAKTLNEIGLAYNVITVGGMDTKNTADRADDVIYKRDKPEQTGSSSIGPTMDGRKKPDLVAPGKNVPVAKPNNEYGSSTGTSFAAPEVTGAVALLAGTGVTHALAAKAMLINSAHHDYKDGNNFLGWRPDTGWGYLDLGPLLTEVKLGKQNGKDPCVAAGELKPRPSGCFLGGAASQGQPGDVWQYKGTVPAGETVKATLTWLRNSKLSHLQNIDLFLYKKVNDAWTRVISSESAIDNVEQVADKPTAPTEYLVKVKSVQQFDTTVPTEAFGLATSHAFQHFTGPEVSVNCIAPPPAQPLQTVTVQCTALNPGQLELPDATATANPGTVTNGSLGTIDAGGSVPFTVTATAPAQIGSQISVTVTVNGTLAEENYQGSTTFAITATGGGGNCPTPTLNPSGPISVPVSGGTYTVQVSGLPTTCNRGLQSSQPGLLSYQWMTLSYAPDSFTFTIAPNYGLALKGGVEVYGAPNLDPNSPIPPPAFLLIEQDERPYGPVSGTVTAPGLLVGDIWHYPPIPGVTIHFQLIAGNGPVPDDVVTDANGAWQASGFTTGLFLGQDLSLGSLYRATPSKAGYSFDPSYYQWGGSVTQTVGVPYFTGRVQ